MSHCPWALCGDQANLMDWFMGKTTFKRWTLKVNFGCHCVQKFFSLCSHPEVNAFLSLLIYLPWRRGNNEVHLMHFLRISLEMCFVNMKSYIYLWFLTLSFLCELEWRINKEMIPSEDGNIVNIQGDLKEESLVAGPSGSCQEGNLRSRCSGEDSGKKAEKEGGIGSG